MAEIGKDLFSLIAPDRSSFSKLDIILETRKVINSDVSLIPLIREDMEERLKSFIENVYMEEDKKAHFEFLEITNELDIQDFRRYLTREESSNLWDSKTVTDLKKQLIL
ncbi:MAG: hypothetical protein K2M45_01200 [Muribaculaceae bacterium]|nr:hypothetical protein [Muribaculaceae bacterium]